MILQLMLLAIAFLGTWLMLQPTRQFTYAKEAASLPEPNLTLSRVRCLGGLALTVGAITAIMLMQI